jgi:hypothetical protein
MSQPLFTIQIDTISACFELKVNDIHLYSERKGRSTSTEIPINHLLISGSNRFSSTISPSKYEVEFQSHSKTDFKIYVRDINDYRDNRKFVAELQFPDYRNDESLKSSLLTTEKEFQADLPFDTEWHKCPQLTLNPSLNKEISGVYKDFFNALKRKDIKEILRLTRVKNIDYAMAYYNTLNERLEELTDSMEEVFNDEANELIDFDIQLKEPVIQGFGKLITLINDNNRSPLQYYNHDSGMTKAYPIYLGSVNDVMTIVL